MNKPKNRPKVKPSSSVRRNQPQTIQKRSVKRPTISTSRPTRSTPMKSVKPPAKRPGRPAVTRSSDPFANKVKHPYRPPVKSVPLPLRPPLVVPLPSSRFSIQPVNRQSIADSMMVEEVNIVESQLDSLAKELGLEHHINAVNDLDQGLLEIDVKLSELRDRGYIYKNFMEKKIEVLSQKWEAVESQIREDVRRLSEELFTQYDSLIERYNRVSGASIFDTGNLRGISQDLSAIKARLSAADAQIEGLYRNIRETFYQTRNQLGIIEFVMDSIEQARFALQVNEGPIQAVNARWWRDGENVGPEGVMYLTDQRLLFEQKEEITTKRILFIPTESELRHELLFEAPIVTVEDVAANNRGIGGYQDHIDVKFGSGSFYPAAHFHLKNQTSEEWVTLIRKAASGEIQSEVFRPESEETADTKRTQTTEGFTAPSKCSSCGAPVPTLSATERQYLCEYCGNVMRW